MLENLVVICLEVLIPICELVGIVVVAVSVVRAFYNYLHGLFTCKYCDVKVQLAAGLGLSLEFKMAAEILKTVVVREMSELLVLGIVIVLRALLSLLIHFEMKEPATPVKKGCRLNCKD